MQLENWFWIGFVGSAFALAAALVQLGRLFPLSEGGEAALGLSAAVKKGARLLLLRQAILTGVLFLLGFAGLELLVLRGGLDAPLLPFAFLSGGLCCALAGLFSAWAVLLAGPRAARAAAGRLDRGARALFTAGAAPGFFSLGLNLLHATVWYYLLRSQLGADPALIAQAMLLMGLGSALLSLVSGAGTLISQGSRMAAGEAEDLDEADPRNPAAIAVQAGHALGSAATLGCTLHSACALALFTAPALGAAAFEPDSMAWNAVLLPFLLTAAGAFCSLLGLLTLRPVERGDRKGLSAALKKPFLVSALLTAALSLPLVYLLTGSWALCAPILLGLALGCVLALWGERNASDAAGPALSLAENADAGAPATLLGGCFQGGKAALGTLLFTAAAGIGAGLTAGAGKGLYGVSLAGTALLSVAGPLLGSALCGPAGQYAAHTALLVKAKEDACRRGADLSCLGAAAENGGRAFLLGGTTLTVLPLLGWGLFNLRSLPASPLLPLLGGALGILSLLLFFLLLLNALRRSGLAGIKEVRRQLRDIRGLQEGEAPPSYAPCLLSCANNALLWYLPAVAAALLLPAGAALLGRSVLLPFLLCGALAALGLAAFLHHAGSVLDAARRYLEGGRHGGAGSPWHRPVLLSCRLTASWREALGPCLLALAGLWAALGVVLLAIPAL